jgi:hypothetical protein
MEDALEDESMPRSKSLKHRGKTTQRKRAKLSQRADQERKARTTYHDLYCQFLLFRLE